MCDSILSLVMTGLVPVIHAHQQAWRKKIAETCQAKLRNLDSWPDVDGRDKPGHDEGLSETEIAASLGAAKKGRHPRQLPNTQ